MTTDHGRKPYVTDIQHDTLENPNFRTTVWTGAHLQLTLMSLRPGENIGVEVHEHNDQFLRVEKGSGTCKMGPAKDQLDFERPVADDDIILVPAGTWHDVINGDDGEMKLYALYGPADHKPGTVHPTKADAENDPNEH